MINYKVTKWFVIIATALIVLFDIVLAVWGDATISKFLLDVVRNQPAWSVAIGVLFGHLFWPQIRSPKDPRS